MIRIGNIRRKGVDSERVILYETIRRARWPIIEVSFLVWVSIIPCRASSTTSISGRI